MSGAPATPPASPAWTPAGIAYAIALFALAVALTLACLRSVGGPLVDGHWALALFFIVYGLFTISVGYRGPNQHYYSFDRVSQVASVLVLGPVDAAWINGLASVLYPLHRLWKGVPARNVLYASLANSGIMTLVVLAAGSAYLLIGGPVPLRVLDGTTILALLVLILLMQLLNDVAMMVLAALSKRGSQGTFSLFSYALELCSGAAAVLVALVFNRLEPSAFVLLLLVLGVGMLALRQFAVMRLRLEGIVEERTQSLRQKSLELERQATRDNLTGLFNRRYADGWLAQQLDLSSRQPQQLVVALADIDHFKQINDQHSHATGDAVLRRVASILQQNCRAGDMVARYGGEEFLLCFPRTDMREAQLLCEELRRAVAEAPWFDAGLEDGVTLSFGLAALRAGVPVDTLVREADRCLYGAKNTGRNRVVA